MLNALTPRGRAAWKEEQRGIALFESQNPDLRFISTARDRMGRVDGCLVDRDGVIRAVVESKGRYGMSLERFQTNFRNEWLVTFDKVRAGAKAARLLAAPLVGFLYLVESRCLLTLQLADTDGEFTCKFRVERTITKKNINGGKACRANAFIDMTDARLYSSKDADVENQKTYPWDRQDEGPR